MLRKIVNEHVGTTSCDAFLLHLGILCSPYLLQTDLNIADYVIFFNGEHLKVTALILDMSK